MTPLRHPALTALAVLALGTIVFHLRPSLVKLPSASVPARQVVEVSETPEDAATRVLALPEEQRLAAAAKLLLKVADRTELAARLARRFCDEDPANIREHGEVLILVLADAGQFDAALRFAELGGPERSAWLNRAVQLWAAKDPARAAQATLALAEGDGFTLVATTWAGRDPGGLADFVLKPRFGSADATPLETALVAWLEQNPSTVNSWLDRLD